MHLEKFSLNFSSSSFVIRVKSSPSLYLSIGNRTNACAIKDQFTLRVMSKGCQISRVGVELSYDYSFTYDYYEQARTNQFAFGQINNQLKEISS